MTCIYEGLEYSEGALVCANGRELVCREGDWRENGVLCEQDEDKIAPQNPDDGNEP
jgi:hypothetical protein